MDILTIIFSGLIAHVVTDAGTQRAVLIAAPAHVARLTVAASDVVDSQGIAEETSTADRERVFLLAGEHVTLGGIAKGSATFDASYVRHVPSLTRVSDGTTLIPEIERGELHPSVAGYIDLGAGTFSVSDVNPEQVSFDVRGMKRSCLARSVAFRAPVVAGIVELRTSAGFLRVRPNATLRIDNDAVPATRGTHFHMYARILADATRIDEPVPNGRSCAGQGAERNGRQWMTNGVASADCSNSNYP